MNIPNPKKLKRVLAQPAVTMHSTIAPSDADYGIETVVNHINAHPECTDYVLDGLNDNDSFKVFFAFKRAGWWVTLSERAPRNRIIVTFPHGDFHEWAARSVQS
jgi:hypothetical protein